MAREASVRSALIIPVPEASSIVDPWRERTCLDKPSIGIPAHLTIVFPFVPAGQLNDELANQLRELVGGFGAFSCAFRSTGRFPGTLYLAPDPARPFVALTEAMVARFPDHRPYEGVHEEIVPHLTVAHGDEELLTEAEAGLEPFLPIQTRVREVLLMEEIEPDWGAWRSRARLAL